MEKEEITLEDIELELVKEEEEFDEEEEVSSLDEIDLSDDDNDVCSINNLSFKFNKNNIEEKVNLFNIPKTTLQVIE